MADADDADDEEEDPEAVAIARANPVIIKLDFREVGSNDDMWDEIDRKLGFKHFGRNLDALVDVLRGGFGHFTVDEYVKLVVLGKDVAAARCDRWPKVVEVINESLDGECGERVAAVEWSD